MKITYVKGENIKGRTFIHQLGPLNIIVGDNMAGKTAVAEAIRLALLGYVPRLGKRPMDSMALRGGKSSNMAVKLGFDSGAINEVRLGVKKSKGTPVLDDSRQVQVPEVLMDIQSYLKRSGPERLAYVMARLDLSKFGMSLDALTAKLKSIKLEAPNEMTEAALREVCEAAENLDSERDEFQWPWQEYLDKVIDHISELKKSSASNIDQMQGLVVGQTQLRAGEEPIAGSPSETEARIKEMELKLREMSARHAKLALESAQWKQATFERHRLEENLNALGACPDIDALRAEYAKIENEVLAYCSEVGPLQGKLTTLMSRAGEARRAWMTARENIQTMRAKLEVDLQREACPYCKSKKKGWQEQIQSELERLIAKSEITAQEQEQAEKNFIAAAAEVRKQKLEAEERDRGFVETRKKMDTLRRGISIAEQVISDYKIWKAKQDAIMVPAEPDFKAIQSMHDDMERLVEILDGQRNLWKRQLQAQQDSKRIEEAKQQLEQSRAELAVAKLALDALLAWKKEIVATGFESLMAPANIFLAGAVPGKLQYREGDIGWFSGESWVGYETMSGVEELLVFAALSIALAQESPIKLVILDELGRLRPERKTAIVKRMAYLLEDGVIDQFIGIDVSGDGYSFFAPASRGTGFDLNMIEL